MERIAKLESLKNHPFYGKDIKKLSLKDMDFILDFILQNKSCDSGAFEIKANRVFLDKPEVRKSMKNWRIISEILLNLR